jgi:hypothetical protein
MTPRGYASPSAEKPAGTLRFAGAPRPGLLPPTTQKAQINPGLSFRLDEKRGSRQRQRLKRAPPISTPRENHLDILSGATCSVSEAMTSVLSGSISGCKAAPTSRMRSRPQLDTLAGENLRRQVVIRRLPSAHRCVSYRCRLRHRRGPNDTQPRMRRRHLSDYSTHHFVL